MHKKITFALPLLTTLCLPLIVKAEFTSNTCAGRYSISMLGGVAPTVYGDRVLANESNATPPAFELINIPMFSDQFNVPFILQGELGYMICNDWEVFYDFDWSYASGKTHSFSHKDSSGTVDVSGTQKFKTYKAYGNYLGTRYYLNFCCSAIKPFAGIKIGMMTRDAVNVKQVATSGTDKFTDHFSYFERDTSLSGGVHIGLDWQLNQNLSLIIKGEVIATDERRSRIIFNHSPNPVLKAGRTNIQFSFPITLGARWTF